jgi:hypothetical protein
MKAAAFVRYNGADGMGHVGWAFDMDAAVAGCGGVEDPKGLPSADPLEMGFWVQSAPDPVAVMGSHPPPYDALKVVDIAAGDAQAAHDTVLWVSKQPYALFGRNCMDDVYDVLRAFGVPNLPPPAWHWTPNNWFATFAAALEPITYPWRAGAVPTLAPPAAAPAAFAAVVAAAGAPVTPSWRVPNSPEWHDLQAQIVATSGIPSVRARAKRVPRLP